MAQTQKATEKETNQTQNQTQDQNQDRTQLESNERTQTPPSRQAGYNQPQHSMQRGMNQNRGLSRRGDFTPFDMMRRFRSEMDRLFSDFGFSGDMFSPDFGLSENMFSQNSGSGSSDSQFGWSPQIESFEREGKLILRADLPGMSKDDVNVDIEDNQIVIHGERRNERESNEQGFYHSERSYGSFYRSIPLPEGIDSENADATFRNGVLEITMPMPKQMSNKRRLEIGEGDAANDKSSGKESNSSNK